MVLNGNLQEHAYNQIKQMLLEDSFKEDTIYSETKLAATIHISRTPVRSALQRLATERFINIVPSKGFILHEITSQDIIEAFHMRCALEGFSFSALAVTAKTEKTQFVLVKLKEIIARQEELMCDKDNSDAYLKIDYEFHKVVVNSLGNSWFSDTYRNNYYHIRRLNKLSMDYSQQVGHNNRDSIRRSVDEHKEFCEMIEKQNINFQELLHKHLYFPYFAMWCKASGVPYREVKVEDNELPSGFPFYQPE